VALRVVEESRSAYGGDDRLFDTPQAIARVFRTHRRAKRFVISAAESRDPQGESLTHHWRVLRGDPRAIDITPLDESATRVELTIPYHERFPVSPGSPLYSNRVDIGVFADNGAHLSAPAFLSVYFPDDERRVYGADGRLLVLDHTHEATRNNYVDPLIDPERDWRDEFHYDERGALTGWTRYRDGTTREFAPDGSLVVARDEEGRITRVRDTRYRVEMDPQGRSRPVVRTVLSDRTRSVLLDGGDDG